MSGSMSAGKPFWGGWQFFGCVIVHPFMSKAIWPTLQAFVVSRLKNKLKGCPLSDRKEIPQEVIDEMFKLE